MCEPKEYGTVSGYEGDELKLVYPQADCRPEHFTQMEFTHRFLQPMDGPTAAANTRKTVEYYEESWLAAVFADPQIDWNRLMDKVQRSHLATTQVNMMSV